MKFFIDTANLAEIREAHDMGILDGVTTNPSLMAKEGISGTDNILKHYKAICGIVDGDVSAEVISTDFAGMVREGELLAEIDPKIVVKVPMIKDGSRQFATSATAESRPTAPWCLARVKPFWPLRPARPMCRPSSAALTIFLPTDLA